MNNVLRLPRTAAGRDLLKLCVQLAGGWDFPDGTNAADADWDDLAARCARDWEDAHREGAA